MEATEIKQKALEQGAEIARNLADEGIVAIPDRKIVALIAYLQKLGKYEVPVLEDKLRSTPAGLPFPGVGNPDRYRAATPAP
jgi:cytochrome c oxidase cbb3-type subunit I/II